MPLYKSPQQMKQQETTKEQVSQKDGLFPLFVSLEADDLDDC